MKHLFLKFSCHRYNRFINFFYPQFYLIRTNISYSLLFLEKLGGDYGLWQYRMKIQLLPSMELLVYQMSN